jgi:hypothetical protein
MSQDIHGQLTGGFFGHDRIGHNTPDNEASETYRPYLPISYPAPWLPGLRVDDGHPVHGQVAISHQMLVGVDKSGALVPAGMVCGDTGTNASHATGAGYYAVKYSQTDVDFGVIHPFTGAAVTVGQVAFLAAPTDGVNTDVVTFPDGTTKSPSTPEITAAKACDLFPGGKAKPIGVAVRNVWQYLGGTKVSSTTNGILYTLDGMIPVKWKFQNYMHEMGTAIVSSIYLRLTWIGDNTTDLTTVASGLSITGYTQTNYGRSFVHFTGAKGTSAGQFHVGSLVKASEALGDAGHFAPFNTTSDKVDLAVGRVMGVQALYPAKDFLNRVRTLWDKSRLGGPLQDPNPASIMMGGSVTGGLPYPQNLGTDGLLKLALTQNKTPDAKMYTVVYVMVKFA